MQNHKKNVFVNTFQSKIQIMITKNHHVSEHDKIQKSQLITSTKQPN